jgi:hypothetical protein
MSPLHFAIIDKNGAVVIQAMIAAEDVMLMPSAVDHVYSKRILDKFCVYNLDKQVRM